MNRTVNVASAEALKADQAARAANAGAVERTATRLEGVSLSVATAEGNRTAVVDRAFWKAQLTHEVDLIYRRGVVVGGATAKKEPALAPKK
jgi:hypothetical protein